MLLASPTLSHAQTGANSPGGDTGTNASPLTKPAAPPALPYPDYGVSQGYLFNLRPLGLKLGKELADYGIYLNGRTFQQSIDVASGGRKRGTIYQGFNALGFDLDMNRIAHVQGGTFHLLINDLAGHPLTPFSGSVYANNRVFPYPAEVRLNEFSYEQTLMDGRLDLRVGRVPTGTEFDTSPTYCEFIYGLCGTPSGFTFDRGYPAYLTASTAGIAKVDLPNHFYANAGFFEDEPSLATVGHLNFPGEDWGTDKWRGVTLPMQFGYRTTFENDPYPKSYDIGGFVDTGDYSDPLANASGRNRILYGGAARVDHGKNGLWLQAEQVVYRPDPTNRRALTVFASANFATSGNANIKNAYFGGFSYKGPFAARPNDSFNVVGHIINLNTAYITAVDSNLTLQKLPGNASTRESYLEVNYGIALAPGVTLKPNFVYMWNPDQVGIAKPVATDKHAVIFGVALSAFLPETLGLPRFSPIR